MLLELEAMASNLRAMDSTLVAMEPSSVFAPSSKARSP